MSCWTNDLGTLCNKILWISPVTYPRVKPMRLDPEDNLMETKPVWDEGKLAVPIRSPVLGKRPGLDSHAFRIGRYAGMFVVTSFLLWDSTSSTVPGFGRIDPKDEVGAWICKDPHVKSLEEDKKIVTELTLLLL